MTPSHDEFAERLTDLECRMLHFERMAEDLSDVIARQDETIKRLVAQVQQLTERLREGDAPWEASPQDSRPPPHY